jgi:hypothetical protein
MTAEVIPVRQQMCPLPKGFWWKVEILPRLDSVHLSLMKGQWWNTVNPGQDSHCAVLDFVGADLDEAVDAVIQKSYEMAQKFFSRPNDEVWQKPCD